MSAPVLVVRYREAAPVGVVVNLRWVFHCSHRRRDFPWRGSASLPELNFETLQIGLVQKRILFTDLGQVQRHHQKWLKRRNQNALSGHSSRDAQRLQLVSDPPDTGVTDSLKDTAFFLRIRLGMGSLHTPIISKTEKMAPKMAPGELEAQPPALRNCPSV
jgi:hypothetical protein